MSYYQRPLLVKNALRSIIEADHNHHDWELVFGDDGSNIVGRPIVEEVLKDHLNRVTFINSQMTFDQKIEHGLLLGKYANQEIKRSDADVGIMLCDDDELHPMYLKNLSDYFLSHPDVRYCYSKIHLFNPLVPNSKQASDLNNKYNQWTMPINPVSKVDASQVAWRIACCKELGAWFADSTKFVRNAPWIKDTDRSFFENLYEFCGECNPTGFVSQYKGVHDYQLVWHKKACANDLKSYNEKIEQLAGVAF